MSDQVDLTAQLKEAINKIVNGQGVSKDFEIVLQSLLQVEEAEKSLKQKLKSETASDLSQRFYKEVSSIRDNEDIYKDIIEVEEEILNLHEQAIREIKAKIKMKIEEGETNDEEIKNLQKLYKQYARRRREKQNFLKAQAKGEEMSKRMLQSSIGLTTEWQGIGAKGFFKGFVKELKRSLTLGNILTSLAGGVITEFFKLDKAQASLFKQSGLTKRDVRLDQIAADLKGIGVDLKTKGGENIAAAMDTYKQFGDLTQSQKQTYAKQSLLLTEMGASQTAVAEIFEFNRNVLKKSPEEAGNTMLQMREIAMAINRPISEVTADMAKNQPVLAMYGDQSLKIFNGLSIEAKRLNMEVSELLGLSLEMDSFEGAAQAAQNFNLAFGGPFISAQALMAASVEDKYKMVAEAFQKSGKKLSRREIDGLAKDAGLDPKKLMTILNREEGAAEDSKIKQKSNEEMQAEATEQIKSNLSIQTRLQAKMEEIYDKLGAGLMANDGLFAMMEIVAKALEFVADNLEIFLGVLVAIKGYQLLQSTRGTAMNPTIVRDIAGGMGGGGRGGRGKKGKKGKKGRRGGRRGGRGGGLVGIGVSLLAGGATMFGVGSLMGSSTDAQDAAADAKATKDLQNTADSENADIENEKLKNTKQNISSVMVEAQEREAMLREFYGRPEPTPPEPGKFATDPASMGVPAAASGPGRAPARSGGGGGGGSAPAAAKPSNSNDEMLMPGSMAPGGVRVNIGSRNVRSSNRMTNSEATYIQPTFHKNDKYYNLVAAKPGGSIITALKTLEEAVDGMVSDLKNSNSKLSINAKELIRAVKEGFNEYA